MTVTTAPGATVTELPPTTRISLRLSDPGGQPLPVRVGACQGAALCLGPDEWLLEGEDAAALVANLPAPFSAVEVSDREITYALDGPAVLDLLATGCPRDLAAMPVGTGTRTVFDTAQIVLVREAQDRFRLTVWRSFAPHVRALLDLAAREFAAGL
jgi:sarcosine oxidase subunit gamma